MKPVKLDLRELVEYEPQPDGTMLGRFAALGLEAVGPNEEDVFESLHKSFVDSMSNPEFRTLIPGLMKQFGTPTTERDYRAALDEAEQQIDEA